MRGLFKHSCTSPVILARALPGALTCWDWSYGSRQQTNLISSVFLLWIFFQKARRTSCVLPRGSQFVLQTVSFIESWTSLLCLYSPKTTGPLEECVCLWNRPHCTRTECYSHWMNIDTNKFTNPAPLRLSAFWGVLGWKKSLCAPWDLFLITCLVLKKDFPTLECPQSP